MKKLFIRIAVLIISALFIPPAFAVSESGYESLHIFSKVLNQVEKNYVETVDDAALIRGAIQGLLSSLDPHTVYMPPEAYKELRVDTTGKFGGVGIEVWIKDGVLTIVAPVEGTPAARADIKAGDKVIKIDGVSTNGMDLGQAVLKMRGKNGTKITLTLSREEKKTFDVTLTRETIKVPSVRSEILDKEYGYIKIRSFQERTNKEVLNEIRKLKKEGALHGLILDMRDNPGGLLEQAVFVSDIFLDQGVIVSTKSRGVEIDSQGAHADEDDEVKVPLIILTNGGTASASEIVAGALKDHGRAVVLGTQTFGKGSVQTVMELDDGSALKLTIALYFTPSGRSIQAHGITPDIIVPEKPPEASVKKTVRESDLPGHLTVPEAEIILPEGGITDYQKHVALNYLKSWEIFRKGK